MAMLRIFLFGAVRIEHHGRAQAERATRGVQTLLAYLLLHRQRRHVRDVLAGLFWGDQSDDSARRCLNTALWRLRRILEPDGVARGTYLVNTARGEVGFNPNSDCWLDVAVLEEHAERLLGLPREQIRDADIGSLEAALALYTGELLEGVYDDWALRERERVRSLYLRVLVRLMQHHRAADAFEQSISYGERILACDPMREDVHRELMRLFLLCGQRTLALRQYERCREVLAMELDVEPMEETQAVHAGILRGTPAAVHSSPERPSLRAFTETLRDTLQHLDQTRAQLNELLRLATGSVDPERHS